MKITVLQHSDKSLALILDRDPDCGVGPVYITPSTHPDWHRYTQEADRIVLNDVPIERLLTDSHPTIRAAGKRYVELQEKKNEKE